MSFFDDIFEIIDPFNIFGFYDEKEKKEESKSCNSILDYYKENGIYPWDDDEDD